MFECKTDPRTASNQIFIPTDIFKDNSTTGFANLLSGFCVDLPGGREPLIGTQIAQWYCNNEPNQMFFVPARKETSPPSSFTPILTYDDPPLCWDVDSSGAVVAGACDVARNSQWWSLSFGQLVNFNTTRCADFSAADMSDGAGLGTVSTTPCKELTVRKEWRDMTDAEKRRFINAFNGVDSTVTIPYWDWGHDGQNPLANTNIFSSSDLSFGTRGDPSSSPPCVTDGFARNWTSNFGACLSRNYTDGFTLYDTSVIAPLTNNTPDFASFAGPLETAHNIVHYYTGGFGTDLFFIDLSPNDPLFFLLHANVDRYWYLWQKSHPAIPTQYIGSAQLPPFSGNNIEVSKDDIMPGFNLPVSAALLVDGGGLYCSSYQPYSKSNASPFRRRRSVPSLDTPVGSGKHGTLKRVPPGTLPEDYILEQHARVTGALEGKVAGGKMVMGKGNVVGALGVGLSGTVADLPKPADPVRRIRENEAVLRSIASQFDEEMDKYFSTHGGANYAEAFGSVLRGWVWKG
ncbi:hypothetical protein HDU67_000068 [Dinochytrium kinnereticum]|nr:hypothetical protein HDU67_000068 [Dinochytrium kinnereticum]